MNCSPAESPAGGGLCRALCATASACWDTRPVCFINAETIRGAVATWSYREAHISMAPGRYRSLYRTGSHLRGNNLTYMRHMPNFISGIWPLIIKFDHSPGGASIY
jgi:hypothetical protein